MSHTSAGQGRDPADGPAHTATRGQLVPLYAAGFVTAFGAHSIAASLGGYTHTQHASLLSLGVLLAVYDGAEIVLKPVFGALADRIGPRPVLLGGLLGFAAASAGYVAAGYVADGFAGGSPVLVGAARLGQGAAAAAFSPAAGALVARLAPGTRHGRVFGSYGAWKGLGYTLGPILGAALITLGGLSALFAALGALALLVALWAGIATPAVAPLPRERQTIAALARRLRGPGFLTPTAALSGATAALAVGVGFLPLRGAAAGLGPLHTGVAVSVLAAACALTQPVAGRARDAARLPEVAGMSAGLLLAAAGLAAAALLPGLPALLGAALTIGVGVGIATPLGFAALAARTEPARLGQTMGAAEVGRELGDAGGPLVVGVLATLAGLGGGLLGLAALLAATATLCGRRRSRDIAADEQRR